MNLAAILLTGLLAGGVSCAAVQGGLLAGLVSRQRAARPATRSGIGEDLMPVAGFLAGKLTSHVLFGALLGAAGTLVELSPQLRATVQVLAGLLIVAFGLAQLGVPGFRGFTVTPPQRWLRFVRGKARGTSAVAPGILGLASILVPCGVTLSVMAIAMTSGSAWAGAVTMGVFVLGTAPLFTLIGYAANKAATAWKGRLAAATGAVVLLAGLYTLNGGLTLMDSPLAAKNLSASLGINQPAVADDSTVAVANGRQTAVINVTPGRYQPANLALKAGLPTTLVFRAQDAFGCISGLVIPSLGVQKVLPENGDVPIVIGVAQAGRIDYSCSMGMYSGTITIS